MPLPTPTPLPVSVPAGRLVLFGGSFDPPHRAHLYFARFILERFPEAAILMVPAARSPHKQAGPFASPEQRCEMLRLGLLDVGLGPGVDASRPSRAGIWTDEIDRARASEPSYWVDTLRRVRSLTPPDLPLSFVMGSDQLAVFHRWREPHEILRLASPLVLVRGGGEVEDGTEVDAVLAKRLLEPIRHASQATPPEPDGATWSVHERALFESGVQIGQSTMAISSTLTRELLRTQPDLPDLDQVLTPSVLAYLRRENPYA